MAEERTIQFAPLTVDEATLIISATAIAYGQPGDKMLALMTAAMASKGREGFQKKLADFIDQANGLLDAIELERAQETDNG